MTAYPNGEYTQTECKQMLELMSANDLLRLLQGGIPKGVRISHKNGWVSDMSGDAGIVFPPNGRDYTIAVYLWQKTDFQDYTKLWPLIEDISRAAWNYFNPDDPLISARTDLPGNSTGVCWATSCRRRVRLIWMILIAGDKATQVAPLNSNAHTHRSSGRFIVGYRLRVFAHGELVVVAVS